MITLAQKKDLFEVKPPQNWDVKALGFTGFFLGYARAF